MNLLNITTKLPGFVLLFLCNPEIENICYLLICYIMLYMLFVYVYGLRSMVYGHILIIYLFQHSTRASKVYSVLLSRAATFSGCISIPL